MFEVVKINVLFSLRQWVGSLICYFPPPFSLLAEKREVTVMKKEYVIQLPLVYCWVMTITPLLTSALPLPSPPSFFIVNYYWSSLGMRAMTRHSMKNYRVLYSLVDWRGLQLRLALGWQYRNSIYTRWQWFQKFSKRALFHGKMFILSRTFSPQASTLPSVGDQKFNFSCRH